MFITKNKLRPGMILSKNIYDNYDFNMVLLAKGQILNDHYIKKIYDYGIEGAFIKNNAFSDLEFEPEIDARLEAKALNEVRELFSGLYRNKGHVSQSSILGISEVVDELIADISYKKELTTDIIDFKHHDEYTYQHCLSVANLSISTGIAMGLDRNSLHDLGMAGFLHDIGKTLIPLEIINKPGKLTPEEFDIIKMHPSNGVRMLKGLVSEEILEAIMCHHEKEDGSGYPNGIYQDDIPFYSKILSICDVYHALSSDRSYRKTCFPNEVMEYLMGCADSHFNYDILRVFLKNIVAFPVGTFVKLSNGMIGVVIKNYADNNMRPIVRTVNQDNTVGEDIDLFGDYRYTNTTIVDMAYDAAAIDFVNIK
ncbi:MAG: HD-GYP domain-containing protein [Sedimentibacter sp.]|uniref:HD-GYP domain-containing protein n=1 Tax=Sedimentibacter sp. TaxID=1960295 RepID=UPI0031592DF4